MFNISVLSLQCNKPLMEKRRRERINLSLNALKSLVLDALKKDVSITWNIFVGARECPLM